MSNLGSRTSSGSFSGPSDLTAYQSANNIWPSAASGGSSGGADNEAEGGDQTVGLVDKDKKVDKRRRGISTGFWCSVFPVKIPGPAIPTVSSSLSLEESAPGLIEECYNEAELWLSPTLQSMGYEETDGIIDGLESVPGKRQYQTEQTTSPYVHLRFLRFGLSFSMGIVHHSQTTTC